MGILEDVNKSIEEVWGNTKTPHKILMSYSQAKASGIDVSKCIPGEPVEISGTGIATAIFEYEENE